MSFGGCGNVSTQIETRQDRTQDDSDRSAGRHDEPSGSLLKNIRPSLGTWMMGQNALYFLRVQTYIFLTFEYLVVPSIIQKYLFICFFGRFFQGFCTYVKF